MKLKDIETDVLEILYREPKARDNDQVLYGLYIMETKCEIYNQPFITVMLACDLIPFESVSRVRRKLQAKYPELRGEKYYKRHDQVPVYIEYNRS